MEKKLKENLLPPLWVIVSFITIFLFWLIQELREIVTLLVISYSIAYVVEPILKKLEKYKISRPIGFFAVFGVAIIFLSILILAVLPVLVREFALLADNFGTYIEILKDKASPILEKVLSITGKSLSDLDAEKIVPLIKDMTPRLFSGLSKTLLSGYSITLTVVNLALLPFLIFYISMSFPAYRSNLLSYLPGSYRKQTNSILSEIDSFISSFVRGQIFVSFILFLLYALGLGVLRIELWFILAVIAGFGNLVPYLGTIIGILLASLMALMTYGDFTSVIYVWIVFGVVQFLEGTFITPRILGKNVGMSPLVIILAIIIGGKLFGLLGIFLAVPGAAIFRVLGKHFHAWLVKKV